jgi:hypothetical protein
MVKWATIRAPEGAEIDRAMIPKVPGCDKKTAYADAHPPPVVRSEGLSQLPDSDARQPVRHESL